MEIPLTVILQLIDRNAEDCEMSDRFNAGEKGAYLTALSDICFGLREAISADADFTMRRVQDTRGRVTL